MEKITLEDIKAWMDAQLAETQDAEERREIVDKAKLQAFNLGALDAYARWTKQPQDEFWRKERENDGGYYKLWELPDFCRAAGDDFSDLEDAYDKGEDEGVDAAEQYEQEELPRKLEKAKFELARAECYDDDSLTEEYEEECRMLKERMDSGECGWGENWWEE